MDLEKGKISSNQLIFFVGIFMQASLFTTRFVYKAVYRDVWFFSLTAFLIYLLFVLMFVKLMDSFPGKTIISINDIVFGKRFGKAVSAGYILFFIILTAVNIRFISAYMAESFMTHTPVISFSVAFILICICGVRSGIEPVARLSFIMLLIVFVTLAATYSLAIDEVDLKNFLPVMDVTPEDFVQGNHNFLSIYFGESAVFLMIAPFIQDHAKLKKSFLLGSLIGLVTLLATAFMITGVLGKVALIARSPVIEISRQIELKNIIPRIESVLVGSLLFSLFMKITATFYASALGVGQVLGLRSYKVLAVPLGLLILGVSTFMFRDAVEHAESGSWFWPFFSSVFVLLLPAFTLIAAAFRGLIRPNQTSPS